MVSPLGSIQAWTLGLNVAARRSSGVQSTGLAATGRGQAGPPCSAQQLMRTHVARKSANAAFEHDAVVELAVGKVDLGQVPKGDPPVPRAFTNSTNGGSKRAADGHHVVSRAIAEIANPSRSLDFSCGGGGNRTLLSAIR